MWRGFGAQRGARTCEKGPIVRVAEEGEIPGEGEVLPEGRGTGGLAPERNGRVEQKDGEVRGQDAVGAAGVEVLE